jgi:hypothetical protein
VLIWKCWNCNGKEVEAATFGGEVLHVIMDRDEPNWERCSITHFTRDVNRSKDFYDR